MTDDLVKRLRTSADPDMVHEAAERIETLEARLKLTEERLKQSQHWITQIRRWIETGEIPR